MSGPRTMRFADAITSLLPAAAVILFTMTVGGIMVAAGRTLGYDFLAYVRAAPHLVDGGVLYDPTAEAAGPFGVFYYPPPFALAVLPFSALPESLAVDGWLALMIAAFLGGIALLPVSGNVRWATLLLAGLQWPFLYTIKLGQVTPLLFFVFAAGWRWIDQQERAGLVTAIGAMIKVQPALLLGWAFATHRWRTIIVAVATMAVLALVAVVAGGINVWPDFVSILARVSRPITTEHNFTPGAIAYQSGVDEGLASVVQWAWLGAVCLVTLYAWLRTNAETSYIVTVVASQAVSPLLWDHYAMLLLLPVAFLLEQRQWWAVLLPLVTWSFLPIAVPLVFATGLLAPLRTGGRGRRRPDPGSPVDGGASSPPSSSTPVGKPQALRS